MGAFAFGVSMDDDAEATIVIQLVGDEIVARYDVPGEHVQEMLEAVDIVYDELSGQEPTVH